MTSNEKKDYVKYSYKRLIQKIHIFHVSDYYTGLNSGYCIFDERLPEL